MSDANLVQAVTSKCEALDEKIAKAEAHLAKLKEKRAAYDVVLTDLAPRKLRRRVKKPVDLHVSPVDIAEMTFERAVFFVAECNEGQIASTPVRQLLQTAGLLSSDNKSASSRLCHFLNDSMRFEKTAHGKYQLRTDWQPEDEMRPEAPDGPFPQYRDTN